MPDFYSKKHSFGNRTYKGILSRTELDEYIKANDAIREIHIFTRENHPDIIYFTDDTLSCLVFGISHDDSTQITNSFPFHVKPRDGIEDGNVNTVDRYMFIVHNPETYISPEVIAWSYEELVQLMQEHMCNCGNPEYGFDCVCDHVRHNPGDIDFSCEFCGIFSASKPRCNKCESE